MKIEMAFTDLIEKMKQEWGQYKGEEKRKGTMSKCIYILSV